ncbi:MSMEG_1061 family FMN-dependent PPOX-type flavoprotein [Kordiimonas pumila]|uniref:MSMEG_1061 family FMN-dependent PPOX-type flavoprotein n=1 Tax=Kordiimonas pumila TaxID=2161677 RepID=A0ABV7D543_9PROT|nr:MSMEG_1061 family FMN-dependent PPOX-type flavoprotein [Kordiimonas pumila]
MTPKDPYIIDSLDELRTYYGEPSPLATKPTLDFLHDHMVDFIRKAPFVVISSESEEGMDTSPRGGKPGCVKVIDRTTVAIGDWPGNNKLETVTNIITSGRCSLLLLVPKLDLFLRMNGTATFTRDPELLKQLMEFNKLPKAAIKLQITQAYFHCGKAFKRSGLWDSDNWESVDEYPKVGKVLNDLVNLPDLNPEELESMYRQALKDDLY